MQLDLDGKVALVTGAAQGVGRAIAAALHREGATVLVSDIDGGRAEATAAALGVAGALKCDVRDEAQVQSLVARAVEQHGGLHVLVPNAGIGDTAPLVQMPFEQWRNLMSINLDGVFLTVKHGAAHMAQHGGGSIVATASATAQNGWPLIGHYAAAKAAVTSLTKTAAIELRPSGVRVNAVCPGFIDTELVRQNKPSFEAALGADFEQLIQARQGRYNSLDEVGDLVAYLACDRAAGITGSAYVIDNGLTASHL